MRLPILALSAIVLNLTAVSQVNIDSLIDLLPSSKADTNKIALLREVSNHYLETNLDSSKWYAQQGLQLAEQLDYSPGQIHHHNLLGNYYQRNSSYDTAMFHYDQVMEISNRTNDIKGKAIGLNNIAIVHTYKGEYPQALKLYQEAVQHEFDLQDTTGIAQAYNNIGVIHYYMGDLEKTLEYFELSIAMSEAINDESVLKKGYNNLGALYDYAKDFEGALTQYEKAYDLAVKTGEKKEMGIMLNNIATAYSGMNQYTKAMEKYRQALNLRQEMQDFQGEANTLLNMGGDQYALGRKKEAEKSFQMAISIAEKYELKGIRAEIYKRMIDYRKADSNLEEALYFSERYRSLKDSLLNEERITAVTEMEAKYEAEQKERQLLEEKSINDQLAKEKAEAELAINRRNALLGVGGAGTLALMFLGLFVIQRDKRKAESEKSTAVLVERDKGIQAVISAQEEERSRISKDLHDGIGQQLSGLKMGFQLLKKELGELKGDTLERIETLSTVLDDSASEVRTISHQMMPKSLEQLGLTPALEDMLNKSLGSCGIDFQFEEFSPIGRLTPSVELSLFRIAQEVVNNIIKHSRAKHVEVQLYKASDNVVLLIEDDGVGFEHSSDKIGHGIINIQNRTRLIDGHLEVDSAPGRGTRINLRVPFRYL